jgi:hypothetical protein
VEPSYFGIWRVNVDDRVGRCVKHNANAVSTRQEVHVWLEFATGIVSEFKVSDVQKLQWE